MYSTHSNSAAKAGQARWLTSSKRNPCPVCGRTKDSDCRISDDGRRVICHHPRTLRPGELENGWAFTGNTTDNRAAHFKLDEPLDARPAVNVVPFPRLAPIKPPRPAAQRQWDYLSRDGQPLIRVHRSDDGNGGRRIWQEALRPGERPADLLPDVAPYRSAEALQALADGSPTVFWVEGEPCADALWAMGMPAVSSIGGAGKFRPDRDAGLIPADRLVIVPDRDAPGLAHARDVAAAHPGCRWLLPFPSDATWNGSGPPTDGLDIADWIANGATAGELLEAVTDALPEWSAAEGQQQGQQQRRRSELLDAALDAAEVGDADTYAELAAELMGRFRMTASHVQGALMKLLTERHSTDGGTPRPGYVDIQEVEHLEHLLPGFVAANEQTLLHAPKGTGKTLAALAIARAIVMGQGLLDRSEAATPGRVLYLATDSGCASMHTQMQELGLLELPEFRQGPQQRFFIRGHHGRQRVSAWEATIPEIVWLKNEIDRMQFDLVIIDSAKACLSLTELEYTDNRAVGALLTLFQRVIAPRAAVLWLHHDGRENGHNAGAKVWAESPVMVHRLERVEPPKEGPRGSGEHSRGPDPAVPPRRWVCVKSRVNGDERNFVYSLQPSGQFEVAPEVEIIGNCREAVLAVMRQAVLAGEQSLSYGELVSRVVDASGRSVGTVKNTVTRMGRGKAPELRRIRDGRWGLTHHGKTKTPLIDAQSHVTKRGKNPVIERDLDSHTPSHTVTPPVTGVTLQPPSHTSHTPSHGVTPPVTDQTQGQDSDSGDSVTKPRARLWETPETGPIGSGSDAFDDDDDPTWGPRPEVQP